MATVLEGLRQCWPVVGYCLLDSQHFGVPQRRRRVFFVCGPTESGVEHILFESEGGSGDFAACQEAGAHLAATLRSRSHKPGVNPPWRGGEDDMNLVVAATLKQRGRGYTDEVMDNLQVVADPITTKPYADHESQENRLVVQALTNLGSGGPADNEAQAGHLVTHALRAEGFDASEDGTGRGTPLTVVNGVRRLTPTECERLQGFPDGWTCLCQPIESYDANRCTCADGPRYKALGNAVTVSVVEWLAKRIV